MKNHYSMQIYMNGYTTITENYKDIISVSKTEGDDRFFHFHLKPSKGRYSNDPYSGIYITIGNPSDYIVYKNVTYKANDLKKLYMLIQTRDLEKEIDSIL
jgi:hypothetical protein